MLQHRHVAQQAREIEHEALRLLAQHRDPGDRQRLVEGRDFLRQAGFAEHDAGRLDGVGEDLVVARQRAQLGAGLLIEIAEGIGRKGRVETVRLGKHRVEGDHDRTEPGQFGHEIGNPGARPRPLPELFQALVVDIDDGDRPDGLLARLDALEGVKGPDADFLDRSRIGGAQRGEPDQQRKAQQPGIADAPREPSSQYPQSFHGFRMFTRPTAPDKSEDSIDIAEPV